MRSFRGSVSAAVSPRPSGLENPRSGADDTPTLFAKASSSCLSIDATEQCALHTTPDHHLFVVGHVLHASLGFLDSTSAARVLADEGVEAFRVSDGCYVAGQLNRATNELSLFSDPLGTRPVFYQQKGSQIAFASQAKWLAASCGADLHLNAEGALQFLMNRYPVGYDSLYLGAHRLAPGQMLRFQPQQHEVEIEQYWDLQFDSRITSIKDAADSLNEVLLESHAAIFDELQAVGDTYRLFLTGGLDSRGILGYAERLGCLPTIAQTWGETDGTPNSDPVIARLLARAVGVPFEFSQVSPEGWVDHAAEWAWRGELQTDNANSYATSFDFFSKPESTGNLFTVVGDQMLGAGPLPQTPEHAIENIMHGAYGMAAGPLSSVLKTESHQIMLSGFQNGVQTLVDQCPSGHPKDIQDYLYFHNYISRWILAPGNFKHPVVSVRRPLMTLAVLNVSRHMAPELRVDKAAYVSLLGREFPHLMTIPKMATESGVRWSFHSRKNARLRDELVRLTRPEKLESLSIRDALDMDAVNSFLAEFFGEEPASSKAGGRVRRGLYDIRRIVGRTPVLSSISNRIQPFVKRVAGISKVEGQRYRYELVMRLALLSLFEDQFANKGRNVE